MSVLRSTCSRASEVNESGRRLLRATGPGRRLLIADSLLGLLSVGLLIAQATLLADVIASAFLDGAGIAEVRTELIALTLLAFVRGTVVGSFEVAGRWGAIAVMSHLRERLAEKLLRDRPGGLAGEQRGELAAASVQGVDALETYFASYLPQLVIAAVGPLAILAWSAPRDLTATLILALTVPLIPVFMVLVGKAAQRRADERWRTLTTLSGHFMDVVTGLKTLRANSRAEAQVETIRRSGARYRDETMRTLRIGFLSALVLELLAMLGVALVAASIGVQLAAGSLDLASGLTILILAPEIYMPLRKLGAQYHASTDGLAAAERIFEILDSPPTVASPTSFQPAPDPARATVSLEGLSLTYAGRTEPALADVSLEIAPGEVVALVGPSGAGKTTLAHLLMRLSDPDRGRIRCAGTDLHEVDPREWRRRIAWVAQRPTILPASIGENVRLGRPEADDEHVLRALRAAGASQFVDDLPEGLRTKIGDGGRALSMGERQRLALARAFLSPASLVVLDEPAASLDAATEREVADAAERLLRGRSGLVIAHRPAFVELADRVVEIRDGRNVEPVVESARRPNPVPVAA